MKQQQLTFEKGITNVPSDVLCSDNALEESIGMVYDNGEHRVVQQPKELFYINSALLFVHAIDNEKNYIYKNGNYIYFKRGNGSTSTGIEIYDTTIESVKAIGKTLIIECGTATYYAVWNGTNYNNYNKLPTPEVNFWLEEGEARKVEQKDDSAMNSEGTIDPEKQDLYNNIVTGFYAKLKKEAGAKNQFLNPFFACAALELFDGSYTRITNPVLLFPSVTGNHALYNMPEKLCMRIFPATLHASLTNADKYNYRYSDIVKSIVIFVSDEIDLCDTSGDQNYNHEPGTVIIDNIWNKTYQVKEWAETPPSGTVIIEGVGRVYNSGSGVNYRSVNDVEGNISSTSVFYKLCSLSLANGETNLSSSAPAHTVENITTQQQLPLDFYSNTDVRSEKMYTYNNRLNLISPKRSFFEGFKHFVSYEPTSSEQSYTVEVYISPSGSENDSTAIIRSVSFKSYEILNIWFYYPDPRAYKAKIYNYDSLIYELPLKEHTGLNGAYYFGGMPTGGETIPSYGSGYPEGVQGASETLYNQIATSEVNNPWVFKAEGYNSVGNGSVIAVATQTQALSQGQFGQYPLIVFATDGIWAMDVNNTGLYQRVAPISRDVLTNENAIVETDNAVFFPSEKGLMVVAGLQVRCVSEQLAGKTGVFNGVVNLGHFNDYLKNAFISYDSRDSLLWIFDGKMNGNTFVGSNHCYIFSIKSGTFGKFQFPTTPTTIRIRRVVRDYPDYLLQDASNNVYTLSGRKNINDDTDEYGNVNLYSGVLISRPMKLENGLALKSLMQIRHIGDMEGTVSLKIYASNNLTNWVELTSLRGTPWKYYRFRYDFSNMKATDRFAGSVVVTQERRTNKLR